MKTDEEVESEVEKKEKEKKDGKRRFWALIIIILLLLLLFFFFQYKINEKKQKHLAEQKQTQLLLAIEKAQKVADSIAKWKADSLEKWRMENEGWRKLDSARIADSIAKWKADSLKRIGNEKLKLADSISGIISDPTVRWKADSIAKWKADSLKRISQLKTDSLPPSPSILPPPGRYYKPVNLSVECPEKKCEVEISIGDSLNAVKGTVENYNKTGKVYFRAIDSVKNASAWKEAAYDMASDNSCAENSYPVQVNGKSVCVDAYEFPNKHGEKPRNMVSQDVAAGLCKNAGKRLCSIEEWKAACRGNANLRYPYGNSYNQTKCATDLKSAKEPVRSGYSQHCRSYWGMYDISGNLWEWTSSPAPREGLFLVAGGAWNTQNASSCTETKFSFYPQNEYPFVGFRCCK